MADVSSSFGVGSRFAQTCFQAVLQEELMKQGRTLEEGSSLPAPRFLGIDELAHRKGHVYDTILCDVEQHQVLEVGEVRALEAVCALLERLENLGAVQAVSIDMRASFRPAVQRCFPHAQIVVDHFHVIQHVMKAFQKTPTSWAHKKG